MKDQMFSQMMLAARQRLAGRDPAEIAQRANVRYDPQTGIFCLRSLNKDVHISYPDYVISPQLDGWHQLVILHYLDLADGEPPADRTISFSQMKDGMVRGSGFDRRCEDMIAVLMRQVSEKTMVERCLALGAQVVQSNADFACMFPLLPNFPLLLKLWFADDEFEASGRIIPDAAADHYLTIEDAVTAGEILLGMLQNTPEK